MKETESGGEGKGAAVSHQQRADQSRAAAWWDHQYHVSLRPPDHTDCLSAPVWVPARPCVSNACLCVCVCEDDGSDGTSVGSGRQRTRAKIMRERKGGRNVHNDAIMIQFGSRHQICKRIQPTCQILIGFSTPQTGFITEPQLQQDSLINHG